MTPIVDGLIGLFWENKIDMLHNLSLSSCASQAKYALAYKDFRIDEDYNPPAQRVFKLTEKSRLNKVENYRQQDEKAKRDTSKTYPKMVTFGHACNSNKVATCVNVNLITRTTSQLSTELITKSHIPKQISNHVAGGVIGIKVIKTKELLS
jgi:hypothetical protein